MIDNIKLAFYMFCDALAEGSLYELIRLFIFRNRIAIPAEIDLTKIRFDKINLDENFRFIELKTDELNSNKWEFAVPCRRIKAYRNLKRGLRGFAVTTGTVIIGDDWMVVPDNARNVIKHPELEMLGIECKHGEVYGIDLLIAPDYRGKGLAVSLQLYNQTTLKLEGYNKLYGFYWEDNVPAMRMHQKLKYRDLPKRRISRFFFYKKSENV